MTARAFFRIAVVSVLCASGCRSSTSPEEPEPVPPSAPIDAGSGISAEVCGFAGNPCCTTTAPCDTRSQCIAGRCEPCGDVRQACCPGNACLSPLTCDTGQCITCGRTNEACCAGATPCFAGLVCNASQTCANP